MQSSVFLSLKSILSGNEKSNKIKKTTVRIKHIKIHYLGSAFHTEKQYIAIKHMEMLAGREC